ncbi:heme lyase CcmF/NrfE family subunit [Desulfohalovibrio reitneri]|uniref:heme lyase CcmF/NrfE family subunit n=1 Tax=Desulfohalovibrio reitneri TaxID=1307759 RepID=UPI0004A6E02B|nr:cytochrome c-type biogenesis CcmF C-terminal domain-containing protein [Desulfohalovibrio reitneri]
MHAIAYWGLLAALLASLLAAATAAYSALRGDDGLTRWCQRGHFLATFLMTLCSAILLLALVNQDFSFKYVAEYTDSTLPLFYAVTAFWAGQAGSLLFWALGIALCGLGFTLSKTYRDLPPTTRALYWLFFLTVQSFFLLLLSNWSNPFIEVVPPPADGRGLNPLLRNPGMIFHPPLLFLGYAGFTIPACLALASTLSQEKLGWLAASRGWTVFSWVMLTAGIVLGAWWSYMELGWGGYWAWDPVENASLIPWLAGTAFLHTGIIQERRGGLRRTNVFLIVLTLLLCFFATYLVRSGVVDSLHAFGAGGVAMPLLVFMLVGLAVTGLVIYLGDTKEARSLDTLVSRPGMLFTASWLLLALGLVIGLGTMWPVITKPFTQNPIGLGPDFYNRVCLPLFTILAVILVFCPWLGWKGGVRRKGPALWLAWAAFPIGAIALLAAGYGLPLSMVAGGAGISAVVGAVSLLFIDPGLRKKARGLGFLGVHAGLGLAVLGVAVSGPFQVEEQTVLNPGGRMALAEYTLVYEDVRTFQTPELRAAEASLKVLGPDGKEMGELTPQRRIYRNFDQPFAEVSTLPSLGEELYATLLSVDENRAVTIKASVHPMVNWIWIGSTLMCIAGLACMSNGRGGSRRG